MFAFDHDTLGAVLEKGPNPIIDWTSNSVEFQLSQKSIVRHSIKSLAEIENNIHLLFPVLTPIKVMRG